MTMPQINFRLTEEEKEELKEKAAKTSSSLSDFCKKLILGYEVVNITPYQTIDKLINLWSELEEKNIDKQSLAKLKNIILEASNQ